jgi:hypothetical protein
MIKREGTKRVGELFRPIKGFCELTGSLVRTVQYCTPNTHIMLHVTHTSDDDLTCRTERAPVTTTIPQAHLAESIVPHLKNSYIPIISNNTLSRQGPLQ